MIVLKRFGGIVAEGLLAAKSMKVVSNNLDTFVFPVVLIVLKSPDGIVALVDWYANQRNVPTNSPAKLVALLTLRKLNRFVGMEVVAELYA